MLNRYEQKDAALASIERALSLDPGNEEPLALKKALEEVSSAGATEQ